MPEHASNQAASQTGLDIFAMTDLSPVQKAIMRIVLRNVRLGEPDLVTALNSMGWDIQPSHEEIMVALEDMVAKTYLHRTTENNVFFYSPQLQRREGFKSMDIMLSSRSGASMATMWQALQTLEEREQGAGEALSEAVGELSAKLQKYIRAQVGAQAVIILMIFLAAANRFTLSALDVVATGGIIGELGTEQIPWVTIAEMIVSVLISGLYLNVIDRLPRVRMMKVLLGLFAVIYLASAGLFLIVKTYFATQLGLLYPVIYLLRSQQVLIFPIVFWNLANSLYSMSEAKRIFPFMVASDTVGSLLGYSLFSLPQLLGWGKLADSSNADALLLASMALLLLNLGLVQFFLKESKDEEVNNEARPSLLENLKDGFELIKDVKLFRYLSLVVGLVWMTFSLITYHFYVVMDATGDYPTYYSIYAIASTVIFLVLQMRATGYFMERVSTRSAFIALPVGIIAMIVPAMVLPGNLWSGIAMYFIAYAIYNVWDGPSFNTLQSLIPEERRGLVVTMVSSYSYAVGSIAGSLAVGLLIWLPRWVPSVSFSQTQVTYGYLFIALLSAAGAIYAAFQVRKFYEESMLSWRLTRRSRATSVLDKLDF